MASTGSPNTSPQSNDALVGGDDQTAALVAARCQVEEEIGYLAAHRDALGDVLEGYGGCSTRRTGPGAYKKALTLIEFLEPKFACDFREAFSEESFAIRTEQVHFWGFPLIDSKIPTPEFLATWLDKGLRQYGLAALSAFLKSPDRDAVFGDVKNFTDPLLQARADLERFETIIERVWEIALRELENLRDADRYRAAQRAGIEDTPPTKISTLVSSLTDAPSGRA